MTKVAGSEQPKVIEQTMRQAQASFADAMGKGAGTYWQQQMDLLNAMEAFAGGWFKRRHAGVQAALEASERMRQATTPAECLSEYQNWAAGAFQRVVADGLACQHEFGRSMAAVVPSQVPTEDKQESGAHHETRRRAA